MHLDVIQQQQGKTGKTRAHSFVFAGGIFCVPVEKIGKYLRKWENEFKNIYHLVVL